MSSNYIEIRHYISNFYALYSINTLQSVETVVYVIDSALDTGLAIRDALQQDINQKLQQAHATAQAKVFYIPNWQQHGYYKHQQPIWQQGMWHEYNYACSTKKNCIHIVCIDALALFQKYVHIETKALAFYTGAPWSLETLERSLLDFGYRKVSFGVQSQGEFMPKGQLLEVWPSHSRHPWRIQVFAGEVHAVRLFRVLDGEPLPLEQAWNSYSKATPLALYPCAPYTKSQWGEANSDCLYEYLCANSSSNMSSKLQIVEKAKHLVLWPGCFPLYQAGWENRNKIGITLGVKTEIWYDRFLASSGTALVYWDEGADGFLDKWSLLEKDLAFHNAQIAKEFGIALLPELLYMPWQQAISIYETQYAESQTKYMAHKQVKISNSFHSKTDIDTYRDTNAVLKNDDIRTNRPNTASTIDIGKEAKYREFTDGKNQFRLVRMTSDYKNIVPGSAVLHLKYGVGIFKGLVSIPAEAGMATETIQEFIQLEYKDGFLLHLVLDELSYIQPYYGEFSLDNLSKGTFQKTKNAWLKDMEKVTFAMLEAFMWKKNAPMIAWEHPNKLLDEFVKKFPYTDTYDQAQAYLQIKEWLCREKPLDCILCGDVGFGKTEIAMRASCQAILAGKQVVWLCPTTVLAAQHYRSIVDRFATGIMEGACIEHIDALASKTKQQDIIQRLRLGQVDLVVGTHRLLSKDVQFANLGLIVIDEEQRFGVGQKNTIQNIAKNVHCISMTATPIPRSLHMSNLGLKDIVLLQTPPQIRKKTQSFVIPMSAEWVGKAVGDELDRGGQVLYIHNRIEELPSVKIFLEELNPQSIVTIVHGQQSAEITDKAISHFIEEKYNILLASTIIESGIDLPNANTIIVQNADYFGLSQLHQLRGRVGRRATAGKAFFILSSQCETTDLGYKRLEILLKYQDLGDGFALAKQDMVLRGTGNVMGMEQKGKNYPFNEATFQKLLGEYLYSKGYQEMRQWDAVVIDSSFKMPIPTEYTGSDTLKLQWYNQVYDTHPDRWESMKKSVVAIFGFVHPSLEVLACLNRIRVLCFSLWLEKIEWEENADIKTAKFFIVCQTDLFAQNHSHKGKIVELLVAGMQKKQWVLSLPNKIVFPVTKHNWFGDPLTQALALEKRLQYIYDAVYQ
jgi:transcription-repair coupling factor